MDIEFFIENSYRISEFITKKYSTSFSLATSLLEKEKRKAIHAIYGFVRLADEIVDSFHGYDKVFLVNRLNEDLNYALDNRISTNTILVAFSDTVKKYNISKSYIHAFMESMKCDLTKTEYFTPAETENYIYGSADVVGLMCLKVFCNGQHTLFNQLEQPARKLGSAFQKVNFLRDLRGDIDILGRTYFPEITTSGFNKNSKRIIEESIESDFCEAWNGIRQLPGRSKLAVAIAYFYYKELFNKIKKSTPEKVLSERIRVSNFKKYLIIIRVFILYRFGRI
ncbi:phytoene synthase [miscellaneous Crenarchaeota group archaeon SMTZ-80]|nr:MAG: phytoene synthase [miscellaneous Crenarchaeota group archaeon SMTZ-80]